MTTRRASDSSEAALASSIAGRRGHGSRARHRRPLPHVPDEEPHRRAGSMGRSPRWSARGVFVQLDSPSSTCASGSKTWATTTGRSTTTRCASCSAVRSGDVVALGDRLMVEVIDAAILRRTVYAKRTGNEGANDSKAGERRPEAVARPRSVANPSATPARIRRRDPSVAVAATGGATAANPGPQPVPPVPEDVPRVPAAERRAPASKARRPPRPPRAARAKARAAAAATRRGGAGRARRPDFRGNRQGVGRPHDRPWALATVGRTDPVPGGHLFT